MDTPKEVMAKAGSYQGLRERAGQERHNDSLSKGEIPADHPVWDVWQQVKDSYPSQTANWDQIPPVAWAYALEGLKLDDIAKGVKTMILGGGTFPPSAPQFRTLCISWEHKRQSKPAHEVLESKPFIHQDTVIGIEADDPDATPPQSGPEFFAAMKRKNFKPPTRAEIKARVYPPEVVAEYEKIFAMAYMDRLELQLAMEKKDRDLYMDWRWEKLNPVKDDKSQSADV